MKVKKRIILLMIALILTFVPQVGIRGVNAEETNGLEDEIIDFDEIDFDEMDMYEDEESFFLNDEDIEEREFSGQKDIDDYYFDDDNNYSIGFESWNDFIEAFENGDFDEVIERIVEAFLGVFIAVLFLSVALLIYLIVVYCKIYKKAGKSGWTAIIPFYNTYVFSQITWGKGWYAFIYMGISFLVGNLDNLTIRGILSLAIAVISIMTFYKLAKAFGKGAGFTCGLIFLYPIFMGILAFSSKVKYVGVNGSTNDFQNVGKTDANYCPHCGSRVDNNHAFCGNCGSKLK